MRIGRASWSWRVGTGARRPLSVAAAMHGSQTSGGTAVATWPYGSGRAPRSGAEDRSRRIESTDLEGMNGGQPDYPDRDSAPQQPPDQDLDYEPEPASRNVVNEDRELDPSEAPQQATDENLDNDQDSLAPPTAGDRQAQAGAENQAENQEEQPGQPVQEATGQYAGMSDEVRKLRDLNHGGQRPASEAATAPMGAPSAKPHAGVTAGRQHQRLRQGTEQAQDSANPERSICGD